MNSAQAVGLDPGPAKEEQPCITAFLFRDPGMRGDDGRLEVAAKQTEPFRELTEGK